MFGTHGEGTVTYLVLEREVHVLVVQWGQLSAGQIIELPVKDLAGPSEESHVARNRVEGRSYGATGG